MCARRVRESALRRSPRDRGRRSQAARGGFSGGASGARLAVGGASYHPPVPRTWLITMAILIACLIASIVIALVRLL